MDISTQHCAEGKTKVLSFPFRCVGRISYILCVERWCNASPEACKKMFTLFAIAGIFLTVCRHGHVLVICDMICSGKLYVTSSSIYYNHVLTLFSG